MYFDRRLPASAQLAAPCIVPGCRSTVEAQPGRGELALYCSVSHKLLYTRTRERLLEELASLDSQLQQPGMTEKDRRSRVRERRYVRWHLTRFPSTTLSRPK